MFDTLEGGDTIAAEREDTSVLFAVRASWLTNVTLLAMKIYCFYVSGSKAILAALVDSVVDLVSQIILALGDHYVNKPSPEYPIGRSRIEALAVLACAAVMIVANVEVIQGAPQKHTYIHTTNTALPLLYRRCH